MIISSLEQVEELRQKIYQSADVTVKRLVEAAEQHSSLGFLALMKFDKIGVDPLEGNDLNIIEQINQLFSDLVVLEAVSDLLNLFPDKSFELHMGTAAGFDIESVDDGTGEPLVVCECFAVTTATSNGKLKKDAEKLLAKAPAQKKFIYFYSHNDGNVALERLYNKFPDVRFKRITTFLPQ